nr:translation initiation factor IF-2 [Oryctolagus cuniculus]
MEFTQQTRKAYNNPKYPRESHWAASNSILPTSLHSARPVRSPPPPPPQPSRHLKVFPTPYLALPTSPRGNRDRSAPPPRPVPRNLPKSPRRRRDTSPRTRGQRDRASLQPRGQVGTRDPGVRTTLARKPRASGRVTRGPALRARPGLPAPRPASGGTRDRGQRLPRPSGRPAPGPPAAHLRVSPPPSAPTVHPAGPGGGCGDAAPTGPRAARPVASPLRGRTECPPRTGPRAPPVSRAGRRGGGRPPCPRGEPAPELRRSAVPAGAALAPLPPPPGSHFGSGGPVAITAQQLTRRRSGAGSGGGGGGARQGGSSRGPGKPRENCPESAPQECNLRRRPRLVWPEGGREALRIV